MDKNVSKSEKRKLKNKKNKKKKIIIKRILTLVIVMIALFFGIKYMGVFNVKKIKVEVTKNIPKKEVLAKSGLKKGCYYFEESKRKRIEKIKEIPNVKNVDIDFSIAGKATVKVDERIPVAQMKYRNKYYIVDNTYKIIKETKNKNEELILIDGLNLKNYSVGDIVFKNDGKYQKLIDAIIFDKKMSIDVFKIILAKNNAVVITKDNIKINMGAYKDNEYKIKMLNEIIKDIRETDKNVDIIEMDKGSNPIVIIKA